MLSFFLLVNPLPVKMAEIQLNSWLTRYWLIPLFTMFYGVYIYKWFSRISAINSLTLIPRQSNTKNGHALNPLKAEGISWDWLLNKSMLTNVSIYNLHTVMTFVLMCYLENTFWIGGWNNSKNQGILHPRMKKTRYEETDQWFLILARLNPKMQTGVKIASTHWYIGGKGIDTCRV